MTNEMTPSGEKDGDAKPWYKKWWGVTGLVIVGIAILGNLASEEEPDEILATDTTTTTFVDVTTTSAEVSTTTSGATTTTGPTTTTQLATTTTTLPVIGSGVYFVGSEFEPGLYRVVGYWARLDANQEIIENDIVNDNGMSLLNVRESDSFVEISGEAIAVADFNGGVADPLLLNWTEGTYLVGVDLAAGQYRISPDGSSTYFARLDDEGDIIDNNISEGQLIVTIQPSDWAFQFTGTLELVP